MEVPNHHFLMYLFTDGFSSATLKIGSGLFLKSDIGNPVPFFGSAIENHNSIFNLYLSTVLATAPDSSINQD
jgi:hypothetical protein